MKAILNRTYSYFKTVTNTFNTSSSFQTYTVPTGVTEIRVDCAGSKGANYDTATGGKGGRVQCVLPVTPGQMLYVYVGATNSDPKVAEYNASDIRTDNTGVTNTTSLNSRLVVAAGGGSASESLYNGGNGGGLTGSNGSGQNNNTNGHGGTQSAGGARGNTTYDGYNGTLGLGGNGWDSTSALYRDYPKGGCGGAGLYGGGGGGTYQRSSNTPPTAGSGGGGSSYATSTCFNVVHTAGYQNGQGYVTITADVPSTESNYDFRTETIEAKVVKQDDKFYAVKSYNKGEYFGE